MSGRFSARNWNTRANMYMPVPAIAQAMRAPKGPVAIANRPGRLKIPAPTMEPMTMAISDESGSFCSDAIFHPQRAQGGRTARLLSRRPRRGVSGKPVRHKTGRGDLPARRFGKLLRISERNFFRAFLAIV